MPIHADFARYYPGWGDSMGDLTRADFEADVTKEVS